MPLAHVGSYNVYRDAGIISIGHFVWTILSVLFVFALLGVADAQKRINLDNLKVLKYCSYWFRYLVVNFKPLKPPTTSLQHAFLS